MALLKSEALVLKVIPFRDTSRILTLYTADYGLVSVLAKGVRGPKPRFGASLEIFAHVDLVYYQKDSRELQLLGQATLLEAHLGLGTDLSRYAHGCAVLELMLKALSGQEPGGRLFPLTLRTLEVLEHAPLESLPVVFRAFELKAMSFLGHRPELFHCVECARPVEPPLGFSPLSGGVICPECESRVAGVMRLSGGALMELQRMLRSPLADLTAPSHDRPPVDDVFREAVGVIETFMASHMDRYQSLRSLRLIPTAAPVRV